VVRQEPRTRDQRFTAYLVLALVLVFLFFLYHRGKVPEPWTRVPYEAELSGRFPGFPVDINTASVEALLLLPGVGKTTAEAIVAQREIRGGFRRVEDLKTVPGIGTKTFKALRSYVVVRKNKG